MSLLGDSLSLLGDETTALAFLPVVNWGYVFVTSQSPDGPLWVLTGTTVVLATLLFNLLENLEVNLEAEQESETTRSELVEVVALVVVVVFWAIMFLWSVRSLTGLFDTGGVVPKTLVVVSVVGFLLIFSDVLFRAVLPSYE